MKYITVPVGTEEVAQGELEKKLKQQALLAYCSKAPEELNVNNLFLHP